METETVISIQELQNIVDRELATNAILEIEGQGFTNVFTIHCYELSLKNAILSWDGYNMGHVSCDQFIITKFEDMGSTVVELENSFEKVSITLVNVIV